VRGGRANSNRPNDQAPPTQPRAHSARSDETIKPCSGFACGTASTTPVGESNSAARSAVATTAIMTRRAALLQARLMKSGLSKTGLSPLCLIRFCLSFANFYMLQDIRYRARPTSRDRHRPRISVNSAHWLIPRTAQDACAGQCQAPVLRGIATCANQLSCPADA